MSLDALFEQIKEDALPGIWSKGVALARDKAVILDAQKPDEWVLRVKISGKAVSPRVSVWDDDAHCDCGDRVEPCIHAVAALVALKNGWTQSEAGAGAASPAQLRYRFTIRQGALAFERVIVRSSGEEQVLTTSLVSFVGGVGSGRLAAPLVPATREDFKLDQVISQLIERDLLHHAILDHRAIPILFTALKDISTIEFEGRRVSVQSQPLRIQTALEDTAGGVRLVVRKSIQNEGSLEFSNGAVLLKDVLRPLQPVPKIILEAAGREFKERDFSFLVSQLLPFLESETALEIRTPKLPRLEKIDPRIILETDRDPSRPEELEVMARLVYGTPLIAEVIEDRMDFVSKGAPSVVPIRNEAAEQKLIRELQSDLHLKPRQRLRLSGSDAVDFVKRSKNWEKQGASDQAFAVKGELFPALHADTGGLTIRFDVPGASATADPGRVLSAWRRGESIAPLLDGGWATIPKEWLNRNIDRLETLLSFRKPSLLEKFQIAEFCVETGAEISSDLTLLRRQLTEFQGIPEQKLPSDLRADLRPYQRAGVNWLGFLREAGLGALLADDMGLGKTLQALCAVKGRTLVAAPTSVLPSWESQIREFRPGLRLSVYYGSSRRLEAGADITLTSYGLLRQDRALLTAERWDTIILDEAQQIKNPDSQIARAAHELNGKFKIALTGTPIENRLDDLWSQFHFIQPGLLGSRAEFKSRFNLGQVEEFKRKIKPLILRRMKKEVAPELPEKTETVLYSTLTESEQSAYRTILAATQEKVLKELESGGGVMGALEALLRLRQVCAHPALVPGLGKTEFSLSSKLELLQETLEGSLALGHSVLIFSQWTGFLDLVEKVLNSMNVEFSRLDGTTRNRAEVIDRFQSPEGPRVMIISLKAGGVGLTLTKADHVIILDPWWNPAVEDQAADRVHRIGQTQPVLVQRFVARDTVEDRILQLQKKKQELARAILDHGEGASAPALELTREDLLALLR